MFSKPLKTDIEPEDLQALHAQVSEMIDLNNNLPSGSINLYKLGPVLIETPLDNLLSICFSNLDKTYKFLINTDSCEISSALAAPRIAGQDYQTGKDAFTPIRNEREISETIPALNQAILDFNVLRSTKRVLKILHTHPEENQYLSFDIDSQKVVVSLDTKGYLNVSKPGTQTDPVSKQALIDDKSFSTTLITIEPTESADWTLRKKEDFFRSLIKNLLEHLGDRNHQE